MSFFAFGFNYESAPVEVRDAFALNEEKLRKLYRETSGPASPEFLVLSTCNRTEVFLYGGSQDVDTIKINLSAISGLEWPEPSSFLVRDEAAIRHILEVTSGLKSMVLGDGQILSQVKDAYRIAVEEGTVGTILHRLMHSAFRTAKRIAGETGLTSGSVSVAGASVAVMRSFLEDHGASDLDSSRVLVVGAGQMAQLALQILSKIRPRSLVVTNRSMAKAREIAGRFGAEMLDWEDRYEGIKDVDAVLVATGSDCPVLYKQEMPVSSNAFPKLLIDISMPRNVDPEIDTLKGYTVLDLDDLKSWMGKIEERRQSAVPAANAIVDGMLAEYVSWVFHQQALQPGIQAIRETFEEIRRQEIERHHHRFSEIDRKELDVITRSIMQKLLAVPVVRLKSVDPESIDFVRGIQLLQMLFSRSACDDNQAMRETRTVVQEFPQVPVPGRWPDDLLTSVESGPPVQKSSEATLAFNPAGEVRGD